MIKAVLFDMGGVLVDTSNIYKRIEKAFQPQDPERFKTLINIKAEPLSAGEITEKEYWDSIIKTQGHKAPKEEIYGLWQEVKGELVNYRKDLLVIVDKLRKNYKTGILSNTIGQHAAFMRTLEYVKHFDTLVFSCDVRMAKPNKKIYLKAAEMLGVRPEECVFIDDIQEFVKAAEETGMKGIVFKDVEQVEKELKGLGLEF